MTTEGIQPLTIYIGAMIMGLFTGIGVAIGNYIFTEKIKPWVDKHKEHKNKINNAIKNIKEKII